MTIGESVKQLLEEGKRVILPGFGNLEVKESGGAVPSSAKRIDPPGLMVRFDGSFSKDDGMLANAFSLYGGLDTEEAQQQVLELVDAIRFALDKGETYALGNAGIFTRDDEGKIHFQPESNWVLEPDQYGLGSMDLLELEDLPLEEEERVESSAEADEAAQEKEPEIEVGPLLELSEEEETTPEAESEAESEAKVEKPAEKSTPKPVAKLVTKQAPKPLSKRISTPTGPKKEEEAERRSGLWKVLWILAGILIVVLIVLILIPSDKRGKVQSEQPSQTEQPAQTGQAESSSETQEQETPVTEQEDPLVDETDPAPLVEEADQFVIIAGSFRNLANASELQDKLKDQGYPAEVMITENRMYRVSVATYPTSGEAERGLENLKSKPGMESCWLLSNE